MLPSLSPADRHAIACHARKLITLMLQQTDISRGNVTAWIVELTNLLRSPSTPAADPSAARAAAPRRGAR
jgi:hypothetical protein